MTPGQSQRLAGIAGLTAASVLLNMILLPRRFAPRVEIERVRQMPMALAVRASGNLEAKESLTLKAQFDAPVQSKSFREGQPVKRGELLCVLSRERIRLDYQNKLDAVQNAESDLEKAKKDYRLQKELYVKQAVPGSSVDDAQRAVVKAVQALRSAKESFHLQQIQWNTAFVYAPFDGTVVKDYLGDDKFVASGKEIVMVADVSEYTVKARVDELDIKQVREGQAATVRLQIYEDLPLPGVVREVGSQPEGNGLPEVPVVLSLPDTKGLKLRPKLTAEARINTGITDPIVSVPLTAVSNAEGEPRVWVLNALGKLDGVPVKLGRTTPDRVEVTDGVKPGMAVVVEAEPEFADGMRVAVGTPADVRRQRSATHVLMRKFLKDRPNAKGADAKKTRRAPGSLGGAPR